MRLARHYGGRVKVTWASRTRTITSTPLDTIRTFLCFRFFFSYRDIFRNISPASRPSRPSAISGNPFASRTTHSRRVAITGNNITVNVTRGVLYRRFAVYLQSPNPTPPLHRESLTIIDLLCVFFVTMCSGAFRVWSFRVAEKKNRRLAVAWKIYDTDSLVVYRLYTISK